MPTEEYIATLKNAIKRLHGVESIHVATDHLIEIGRGVPVWEGDVETFGLFGHPKARMCYAWSYQEGTAEHFTTVLQLPPVRNAVDAVRAHLAAESKQRKSN